jgi:zinc transport system substrate-binding protein
MMAQGGFSLGRAAFRALGALAALAVFLITAWPAGSARAAAPLPVLASIAPQKYMLERIAGDSIAVTVLVKPGSDPHSYEPGPSHMRQAAQSAAWFTIGVPFEEVWLDRIKGVSPNLRIISCIKGIQRLPFADHDAEGHAEEGHDHPEEGHDAAGEAAHGHDHDHGALDPHVWLSPMLAREMLSTMARELGKLLPDKAASFRAKAQAFASELEELDRELALRFLDVPEDKRVFLTFHPSWRYFAFNYGLREIDIEVEGKEPGPKRMKEIIDTAKEYGIRAVIIEPQFPRSAARAIAESLGARVLVADPLAEDLPALYRDFADKLLESFPKY